MDEVQFLWLVFAGVLVCIYWKWALLGLVVWLAFKYGVEPEVARRRARPRAGSGKDWHL